MKRQWSILLEDVEYRDKTEIILYLKDFTTNANAFGFGKMWKIGSENLPAMFCKYKKNGGCITCLENCSISSTKLHFLGKTPFKPSKEFLFGNKHKGVKTGEVVGRWPPTRKAPSTLVLLPGRLQTTTRRLFTQVHLCGLLPGPLAECRTIFSNLISCYW